MEDCWIFVGDKRHANWVLGIPTAPLNSLGPSKDFPDPDGYPREETLMKILDRLFWQNQTKVTCQCLLSVILQWVASIFAGAKRCCPQILLPILCPKNLKFIWIQQIVLKLGIVSEFQTTFGSCADFIVACCQNLPKLAPWGVLRWTLGRGWAPQACPREQLKMWPRFYLCMFCDLCAIFLF